MRWKQPTALVLAAGALCGCTTLDGSIYDLRYGPSPVLVAETVQASVARQEAVVRAVYAGAQRTERNPVTGDFIPPLLPRLGDRQGWYEVILIGFNVIDDACISYIDNLWIMERQRRNSNIIHAAGAAGAALLSAQVTPQTAAALLVLSQAFHLAGLVNNAIADSYLYTQPAATIKKIIRKTTTKYRTVFAANVSATDDEVLYPVASPGAAYHRLREYLSLCLPPTIQAQIDERLNGAKAIPEGSEDDVLIPRAKTGETSCSLSGAAKTIVRKTTVRRRGIIPATSITLE